MKRLDVYQVETEEEARVDLDHWSADTIDLFITGIDTRGMRFH